MNNSGFKPNLLSVIPEATNSQSHPVTKPQGPRNHSFKYSGGTERPIQNEVFFLLLFHFLSFKLFGYLPFWCKLTISNTDAFAYTCSTTSPSSYIHVIILFCFCRSGLIWFMLCHLHWKGKKFYNVHECNRLFLHQSFYWSKISYFNQTIHCMSRLTRNSFYLQ